MLTFHATLNKSLGRKITSIQERATRVTELEKTIFLKEMISQKVINFNPL